MPKDIEDDPLKIPVNAVTNSGKDVIKPIITAPTNEPLILKVSTAIHAVSIT